MRRGAVLENSFIDGLKIICGIGADSLSTGKSTLESVMVIFLWMVDLVLEFQRLGLSPIGNNGWYRQHP